MAICKYCGKYTDITEWPEQFREIAQPNLCFSCYTENPDRADYGHTEELEPDAPEEVEPTDDGEEPDDSEFEQPDATDGETEDKDDIE